MSFCERFEINTSIGVGHGRRKGVDLVELLVWAAISWILLCIPSTIIMFRVFRDSGKPVPVSMAGRDRPAQPPTLVMAPPVTPPLLTVP